MEKLFLVAERMCKREGALLVANKQLQGFLEEDGYLYPFKSSFRSGSWIETALVDDCRRDTDRRHASLWILLNVCGF